VVGRSAGRRLSLVPVAAFEWQGWGGCQETIDRTGSRGAC
jgi:hypothetical protein